jgi:alpha-ketoglutarate-dependent taurine dioxygenase
MNFDVEPISDTTFGARVTGLKLAAIDEATFADLYQTWLAYALLIFPGQHLSKDEQTAFARRFGELEFDLVPISNVRKDGTVRPEDDDVIQLLKGNYGWHHDSTYVPVQAKGAVFTAHVVPSRGGATGWADMRAAYDALDETMRERIANLSAYHSLRYSQAKIGHTPQKGGDYAGYGLDQDPPLRPLVKTHPATQRKSLLVGRHAYGIVGLAEDESEALLQELMDFACQPPRIHYHQWEPGDAVLWDNRCLMHRATPWPMHEPRIMYHARIAGDKTSEFAAPA